MTQDEIIEMANQAGIVNPQMVISTLESFAKLVAQHAKAEEREACAKVCEETYTGEEACSDWPTPEMCASAIRARGEASIRGQA